MRKRIFAAFVCLCMMVALVPSMAYAGGNVYTGGLCEHHPQHDESCGYSESTAEVPCNHEHTEECYKQVTNCIHEHTEECYSEGSTEPDLCSHVCSEETGCIVKELDCKHVHDENCGYVPATEGTPCSYVCAICNPPVTEEQKCICDTKCTEGAINENCPVCGGEDGDISACEGKLMTIPMLLGSPKSGIPYLDENGDQQTVASATQIESDLTSWTSGWYVVDSDIEINNRVTVNGDVNLILANGCTLTINSGIGVKNDNKLTVYAQSTDEETMGKLIATAVLSDNAGIGGNSFFDSCGTIVINGGWIEARGNEGGAGIGSGGNDKGNGNITINGGNVFAYGDFGGAGIGAGDKCRGSNTITINGGNVYAESNYYAAGIGAGDQSKGVEIFINGGEVTAIGGSDGAGIGGGSQSESCTITISGGIVDATGGSSSINSGAGIGSGLSGKGCKIIISDGNVTGNGGDYGAGIGSGSRGIVNEITIYDGDVTGNGGDYGAGIGSGYFMNNRVITIYGGTVNAYGGDNAAGIGGGQCGSGGTINIYGGTVTAKSGKDGKGIGAGIGGGGDSSKYYGGKGGTTIISGGTVTAMGNVGIGGGKETNDHGVQRISPASGLAIIAKAGADEASAAALIGSPFARETVVTDLIAGTKYFHTTTCDIADITTITVHPQNVSVTEGKTAVFEVTATGIGTLTYQWQQSTDSGKTWTDIVGANTNIYTITNTTLEMTDNQYRCVVTGDIGIATSNAVTLTVQPLLYTITMQTDGYGTASASLTSAQEGTTITLTANPNSGYRFARWEVISDNITITNNTFVMPAENVTIKAIFNRKSSGGGSTFFWDLKFDTNGGSTINTITEWEYSTIDLDEYVPEKEGYKFAGWYADDDFDKKIDEVYLTEDTTVYAKWEKIAEEVPEETEEEEETEIISFKDVKESDWFYKAVSYAVENGLMSGMSEDIFAPNTPLTREMLAVVLYNVEGQPESAGVNVFTDVKADMWYTDAILWANENGIVAGYENGAYGVCDLITREQFAAILYRYAQFKGYDTTQGGMAVRAFSDYENISDYARPAMAWAVNADIMGGMDDGTLMPQGKTTRAEAATMLMNFCENVNK